MRRTFLGRKRWMPAGAGLLGVLLGTGAGAVFGAENSGPRLTGVSLGVGDWIVATEGSATRAEGREHYGTLPSLGLYAGWGAWKAGVNAALRTSYKREAGDTRTALGDGALILGRNFGAWNPRVLLEVPLYSWSRTDPSENELFIGAGNVNAGAGVQYNIPRAHLPGKVRASLDLEGSLPLTRGLADYGSYHARGTATGEYAFAKRWKAGVSALFLYDNWEWIPAYWDEEGETKFSIVPGAFVGLRAWRATYLTAKAGISVYDAQFLRGRALPVLPQRSWYFSASVYQGF